MTLTTYKYRGNHTGPDMFDTKPTREFSQASPYDVVCAAERDRGITYWYGRGMNDREIGRQVGCSSDTVSKWRRQRDLPAHPNYA